MLRPHPTTRGSGGIAALMAVTLAVSACSGSDDSSTTEPGAGTVPATSAPSTVVPESTVPETTAPETTVLETTVPETTVPDATVLADELATALQTVLDEAMRPGAIDWARGGVDVPPTLVRAGIRVDGRPDAFAISGTDVDGGQPGLDDPFGVSTLTGSLARTIAFQLIDEGALDPAATIDAWAPDMPGASNTTIEQLVDRRTGWSEYGPASDGVIIDDFARRWTLAEVVMLVSTDPQVTVSADPTVANTSDLTTDIVLAHVLEQVSGRSFPDLVMERIADPLGLDQTLVRDGVTPIEDMEAGVFDFQGAASATSDFDATSFLTWSRATQAGASSVPDLLDLLDAWAAGSLFATDRTPDPGRFGADRATSATDPTSYVGLGIPFNGYCPCVPEGDGHDVTAIGRTPGGLGTLTYLYRYADGISIVLHFNSDNVPDRTETDALVDRIHETAVALA